jgi:signal transduction histidine kinase/CheY-like chemotaxis protein
MQSPSVLLDLLSQAPGGLGLVDPHGRLLWLNDYLAELLDLPAGDQAEDRRLVDHLTPASRIMVQTRLRQELAMGGRLEELALDVLASNGDRIPVMVSAAQTLGTEGPLIQLCVSRAPVRRAYEAAAPLAEKRAEAERRSARDVISAFVRHCPVPLIMTDADLVATGVSQAWEKTYGRPAQDMVGQRVDSPARARPAQIDWPKVYARALAGEAMSSDGPVRSALVDMWFEWAVIPWRDAEGAIGGLLLMNFDVSALVRARDAAAAADAAKSRFLANLSHELRTPLNSVLAPLELLRGHALPEAAHKALETVAQAGAEVTRRITTLLDFSQLEGGGFTPQSSPLSARTLCDEVLTECADLIGDRPIVLSGPDTGADVQVSADGDALKRILIQLVANGVKFTETGAVSLDVQYEDDALVFTVADTGCGFDIDSFDALVRPFHQRDVTATRKHGGMGLGLALADGLARAVGGELTAQSTIGVGSRVTLRAPAVLLSTPEARSAATDAEPAALRILAVDDNPANLAVLTAVLAATGAEVTCAANGLEAVELSRSMDFDLVLMDVQMPVMDGLTAMRIIRAEHPCPPPMIVVSANVSRPEVAEARAAGAVEVLGKPVGAAVLLQTVGAVLQAAAEQASKAA